METFLIYLLNASAGIVLFFMVYWLFLRKETFHTANRWFMLGGLVLSVVLPLLPIQYEVIVQATSQKSNTQSIADTFKNIPVFTGDDESKITFSWQQALILVYFTGVAIFLLRLLTQTFVLFHLMVKHQIKSFNGIRIVENEKYGLPFSFFNIVFINPKFHTQDELPEILAHEKVHIRENHWFDLLFIELLTVIFWFNPFIWLFERSIKQNHEYLADKGVLAQGHTVGKYQAILVNQLMGMQIIGITNNLNFALNTNRLKMMTKKKTSANRLIRFTWAIPIIALLLYAFAEPNYQVKKSNESDVAQLTDNVFDYQRSTLPVKVIGKVTDTNGNPMPGTSVVIKGTTVGTVSDLDGNFKIENVQNTASVVFSFVGCKTVVRKLNDVDVAKMKIKMEDEVIGIGLAKEIIPIPEKEVKAPPPPPPPANANKEGFYIIETMPNYHGGPDALNNYTYKMQQKIAKEKGVKGKAKVMFTVNTKGKVSDIKVVEKDNDSAAKGAYIICKEMKDWTPGKQRGKPVSVKYMMPVEFK